jgi:hypothetical protein
VCRDVINADKHLKITRYDPITEDVSSEHGYGRGRYGKGGYGIGEKEIQIRIKDGRLIDALAVVRAVVAFWDAFFARHFPA